MNLHSKYYNSDGQVAIILSGGYGAGWYTWNLNYVWMISHPELVQDILDKKTPEEIQKTAEEICIYLGDNPDNLYFGGVYGLYIEWIPEGTQFMIHEYDGHECLIRLNEKNTFIA